jgi:hypothetical protein
MNLLEPVFALKIVILGGWTLVFLGAIKMAIYLVGELAPQAWSRVRSEWVRKFVLGTGNRILFGLGGSATVLLGLVFVGLGKLLLYFHSTFPR